MQEPFAGLLYSGGTVAATSIDVELAGKGKSLDGFIAYLTRTPGRGLRQPAPPGRALGLRRGGHELFFNDYITGTATIPASAFSQLKLEGDGGTSDSDSATAGTDIGPAPAFGRGWMI